MKRNKFLMAAACGALALGATGAQAHALDGAGGLAGGLAHPFIGLDHLLAMIAVGLWAAQWGGQASGQVAWRAAWQIPLGFVTVMAAGFGLARLGLAMPLVEPMIVVSVAVMGLVVAGAVRLPLVASIALVSAFAVFHGFAHGVEMPPGSPAGVYAAGFVLATAALHLLGLGLGLAFRQRPVMTRLGGGAIALTGMALMGGL